jgi:glycopeptide antibiotics resistance protein
MLKGLRMKSNRVKLIAVIFVCYCVLLLYLLFFSRSVQFTLYGLSYRAYLKDHINLVPLRSIRMMIEGARYRLETYGETWLLRFALSNILGNIVLFLPFGFFVPCLWHGQRKYWKFILTALCLICAVETLQLVSTLGSMDVDDLLSNLLGASLGYGLWRLPPVNRALAQKGFLR